MSETRKINELYRRVAGLDRRIGKLEDGMQELDRVVDPQGWIGEAFERLEEDIEELRTEVKEANGKLDIVIKHLTGSNI
ncbi:MAG: hypothetical protein AAGA60_02830 [Cyanobacteria bacterium P01_E01_bin.42]